MEFLKDFSGKTLASVRSNYPSVKASVQMKFTDVVDSAIESYKAGFKQVEAKYAAYENFYNRNRNFRMAFAAFSVGSYVGNVFETKKKELEMLNYRNYVHRRFSSFSYADDELSYQVDTNKRDIKQLFESDKELAENLVELGNVLDEKAEKVGLENLAKEVDKLKQLENLAKEVDKLKQAVLANPRLRFVVPVAPGVVDLRNELRFQQALVDRRRRELEN